MSLLFTYHSSNIYPSDVATLNSGCWLNDAILTFYCDCLQHDIFTEQQHFRFINPQTLFVLMHEEVNNNKSVTGVGGTHWSLLCYECKSQQFYTFDSMGSNNLNESKQLANKLYPLFLHFTKQHAKQPSNKSNAKKTAQKAKASATVNVAICPQQNNSYDCGVYTLGCCEQIATYLLQADTTDTAADDEKSQQRTTSLADTALQTHLKKQLTASNITVLRTRIKQAIQQVQKTYK